MILTKPLGVGVMTTALKKGLLPPEGYDEVCYTHAVTGVCGSSLVVLFVVCVATSFVSLSLPP